MHEEKTVNILYNILTVLFSAVIILESDCFWEEIIMIARNYSDVRNNLKSVCDTIIRDSETVIVTRKNDENIVMMSLDEYNNLIENYYIRRSEANYKWIQESKEQLEKGKTINLVADEQFKYET